MGRIESNQTKQTNKFTDALVSQKVSEYDQEIPQAHTTDKQIHDTTRKRHRTITATIHQKDN